MKNILGVQKEVPQDEFVLKSSVPSKTILLIFFFLYPTYPFSHRGSPLSPILEKKGREEEEEEKKIKCGIPTFLSQNELFHPTIYGLFLCKSEILYV
jgi:hypothetical protein